MARSIKWSEICGMVMSVDKTITGSMFDGTSVSECVGTRSVGRLRKRWRGAVEECEAKEGRSILDSERRLCE